MPLQIPARKDVSESLQAYVRSELPSLDPTPGRRSKIGAWVKSLASALYDWYWALKDYGDHEPFPQSARGDFLYNGWWAPLTKLNPIPASPARGYVVFTGSAGTAIPAGSILNANAITYTTQAATTIVTQTLTIDSMVYDSVNNCVTATTKSDHLLASSMYVTVTGAPDVAYNGTFQITVMDNNDFTYTPSLVPGTSPVSGSIAVTATWGVATVEAETVGANTNVSSGGTLSLVSSVAGADTTALATFGGVAGGEDTETADSYRARILQALGTDFGVFSADEIAIVAKTVPGVTRVWVMPATLNGTNGINEGQVLVAFVRDNDGNIIPSAQEVADVKTAIVTNIMPAHTAVEDVMVISPTPRPVNITVSITPDTVGLRAAVRASLNQYFQEVATFATNVPVIDLQCAIKASFDMQTRQGLKGFTLASPVADVSVGATELPMLGTVTFSA